MSETTAIIEYPPKLVEACEKLHGIGLNQVQLRYGPILACAQLTGQFPYGSLTAIVGPNGAGKTTLIKAILGEIPISAGSITISGFDRREIAYLPQQIEFERDFPITVYDVVAMGLWRKIGLLQRLTSADQDAINDALIMLGLQHLKNRTIGELSAGQLQRVLFARLSVQQAPCIILDEPFNALDEATSEALYGIIQSWHKQGRTIIAVMHDLEMVRRLFPSTLLLAREVIAWGRTNAVLTPVNIERARRAMDSFAGICTHQHGHSHG
ncbi:MAG: metal ABC transporter ATP-binding protein [Dongiaceae bacterium]